MSTKKLKQLSTFDSPQLAHIARSRLESEGIAAFLEGEHHVAMDWLMTTALGGIKLMVAEGDLLVAAKVLETQESFKSCEWFDEPLDESDTECPSCGSCETYFERQHRRKIFLSVLLLGFPLPFISSKNVCESCDHRWKITQTAS